jgi:exosortase/archaeosortase family protein
VTRSAKLALLRVAVVAAVVPLAFVFLSAPEQSFEAALDRSLLAHIGLGAHVPSAFRDLIVVRPFSQAPFLVEITPSCTALASVVALVCLVGVLPAPRKRRLLALVIACAGIYAGNILRIEASIIVGIFEGRATSVLFHNWVGATFGFLYTVGGFVLVLYICLPALPPGARAAGGLALEGRIRFWRRRVTALDERDPAVPLDTAPVGAP